jgi:hypothetical protein
MIYLFIHLLCSPDFIGLLSAVHAASSKAAPRRVTAVSSDQLDQIDRTTAGRAAAATKLANTGMRCTHDSVLYICTCVLCICTCVLCTYTCVLYICTCVYDIS